MDFDSVAPHPLDEEAEGGIVWNPASAYVKEMRKWEQHHTEWTAKSRPGNPYVYREFPKMLYKAQRDQKTQRFACLLPPPDPYAFERPDQLDREQLRIVAFNTSCTRIVRDEAEERIAKGQGWTNSPTAAMELHEADERALGNAAAEAAYAVRGMSEKARHEFKQAGEATHQHVTDIKGTKKGAKAVTAVEEE